MSAGPIIDTVMEAHLMREWQLMVQDIDRDDPSRRSPKLQALRLRALERINHYRERLKETARG